MPSNGLICGTRIEGVLNTIADSTATEMFTPGSHHQIRRLTGLDGEPEK